MKYIITLLALITLLSSNDLENYLTNNLKNNKEIKKEAIRNKEIKEVNKYKKNTLKKIKDSISISGSAVYRYEKKN